MFDRTPGRIAMTEELDKRRRALEEAFFNKYNEELVAKLRDKERAAKEKEELAEATGIRDPKVLDDLRGMGVRATTLAALAIAPLVLLAWRDGKLDARERGAILRAAEEQRMDRTSHGYQLLEKWLEERPGDDLVAAWKGYVGALRSHLPEPAFAALRADILTRTRAVAESAGGFLGLNRVSKEEKELLARIEEALR
jgi:hypothetical protein